MAGSSFGTVFRITTWGESHGKGIGVILDGVPAGLPLTEDDIQPYLDRRRPGQNRYTTARKESDLVHIMSGTFEGKTTGTPLSLMIMNTDQHSSDYSELASCYRPGHADLTFDQKYGFRDYRGGGRSSGRETAARVAAGAVACRILEELGIHLLCYTASVGPISCSPDRFNAERIAGSSLYMPDEEAEVRASAYLEECMKRKTSSGGTVECIVSGMKAGIGEPVFNKLDALLGQALFSIGAVKAVEIGSGKDAALALGHENNDQYRMNEQGIPVKQTNHAGGILGGISDGSDLLIRVSFKPTPSVSCVQSALYTDGTCRDLQIKGRHDPFIPARANVVVESMTAVTILDLMMISMSSRMDRLKQFFASF